MQFQPHSFLKFLTLAAVVCAIFSSCDLELQEQFEFDPALEPQQTFEDMTVLEWLRTNPREEFDYMLQAIELTGLEAEYSTNTERRTYILLKDRAFTDGGEILQTLTGSREGSLDSADVDRLANILRYHIVTDYIENDSELLFVLFQDYLFQSLVPDFDGQISFQRDERFRLQINRSNALAGTKKAGRMANHNYIFSNGVAHLTVDHYRNVRF